MKRAFIVGWDGATFDLMEPWLAEGKLPNIAKVIKAGVHGRLRSTLPPMTFPAWSTFMTGKNPGKHGIYDFTRQKPGKYELEFVNGGKRRAASFWRILSDAGRKVISISVPCTYPPEDVNGIMISGFDGPGQMGADYVDARGMHPAGLYEELNKQIGGHPIGAFVASEINSGHPEQALERMLDCVRKKSATAKYLLENKPWDCMMILFGESDGVGHHFWKYCDPQSPLYEHNPAVENAIFRVYEELDKQLGELLAMLPADTTLLMMSDHGFGGVSNWVLYPNCWLSEMGFLKFRGQSSQSFSRGLEGLKLRALATLPVPVKKAIYKLLGGKIGKIESQVRYAMIDWAGSDAYFEENPYYPALWVNLQGRQPQGTVAPGKHYEEVRDRLIEKLTAWRHPKTGQPIVEKALRREEVYSGPLLNEAPDIVVKWNITEGYNYAFKLSAKSLDRAWIKQVDPREAENMKFFTGKSGHHRDEGIFLALGPFVRKDTKISGARIMDIAPTLLNLLGVKGPDDMDGRVLSEIFTPEYEAQAATPDAGSAELVGSTASSSYSDEDEAIIAERLKALGYIE
jgi:predicted AlkP superfamily phosphohydrolase/phosphomutase